MIEMFVQNLLLKLKKEVPQLVSLEGLIATVSLKCFEKPPTSKEAITEQLKQVKALEQEITEKLKEKLSQ